MEDGQDIDQDPAPEVTLSTNTHIAEGNNPSRKQYVCTHENCNKSFTRSDHLKRHSLNHATDGKSTCPRCSVTFNRPDLLERHLARHRQRDEEAGGYGLGVVETRKRMWRDADGNIVTKRPTLSNSKPAALHQQSPMRTERQQPTTSHGESDMSEPLLTPRSMSMYSDGKNQQRDVIQDSQSTVPWNIDPSSNLATDGSDMCDFLTNSSWGTSGDPQTHSLAFMSNPFDDMFSPDTASSFNMPFTTMNNYNWLFNQLSPHESEAAIPFGLDEVQSRPHQTTSNFKSTTHIHNMNQTRPEPSWSTALNGNIATQKSGAPDRAKRRSTSSSTRASTSISSYEGFGAHGVSAETFSTHQSPASFSQSSISEDIQPMPNYNDHFLETSLISNSLETASPKPHAKLPVIDDNTRGRILEFIVQANPKTPEGASITRDHDLLSLSEMQGYCDLFFCRFNVTYPLLHQSSFDPSQAETLLLISILLLGATYGHKAGHRLAVCIHDVLRAQIFQNAAFQAKSDLWLLQTILLVECFGKSRAGQTQHDMAHLFHGLLINLIRRSDCQGVSHHNYTDRTQDLNSKWRTFIDIEQRKRLAFLCFLWDTQHAVLFSQSLCMSAFELRSSLPCNPKSWLAETAEDWIASYSREKEIWFLAALKLYVNPGPAQSRPVLNDLSRLLILHGLMSISWDMKRREQTALGLAGATAQDMRMRLARSYDAWKADFDAHCMGMTLSLKGDAVLKSDFIRFSTASTAIYHAAHITLNVEILDLQIYAGAKHIIGRPVTHVDYERSRRIVKQWVKPGESQAAGKAAWHAAHLLRDGIMNLDNWDVNDVFHYPWCLYIATLTCWAFHFAGTERNDHDGSSRAWKHSSHSEETAGDDQAEMSALVSGMTSITPDALSRTMGQYSTNGLIAVVAKHLSTVRWAVIHEGMKILKGLVLEKETNIS